jgi:hypothetical protein
MWLQGMFRIASNSYFNTRKEMTKMFPRTDNTVARGYYVMAAAHAHNSSRVKIADDVLFMYCLQF